MGGKVPPGLSADLAEWRRLHRPGRPPRLLVDAELRDFVDVALESLSFVRVAAAARERFGPRRAPSKSTVHRYWQRYRKPELRRAATRRRRGAK